MFAAQRRVPEALRLKSKVLFSCWSFPRCGSFHVVAGSLVIFFPWYSFLSCVQCGFVSVVFSTNGFVSLVLTLSPACFSGSAVKATDYQRFIFISKHSTVIRLSQGKHLKVECLLDFVKMTHPSSPLPLLSNLRTIEYRLMKYFGTNSTI